MPSKCLPSGALSLLLQSSWSILVFAPLSWRWFSVIMWWKILWSLADKVSVKVSTEDHKMWLQSQKMVNEPWDEFFLSTYINPDYQYTHIVEHVCDWSWIHSFCSELLLLVWIIIYFIDGIWRCWGTLLQLLPDWPVLATVPWNTSCETRAIRVSVEVGWLSHFWNFMWT